MITVTDLYSSDLAHLEINRFFLNIYQGRLGQRVHFFAERKHAEAICRKVPVERLYAFGAVRTVARWHAPRVLLREILTLFRIIHIVTHARRMRSTFLHVLCASHFAHLLLRIVLTIIPPRCPVLLGLHSELESLAQLTTRPWEPGFWFRLSLRIPVPKLFPIVLGRNILQEAERRGISTVNWLAIEHPYEFSNSAEKLTARPGAFTVGAVGAASVARGTHLIFDLAKRFRSEIMLGLIRFRIIGKIYPNLLDYATADVEMPPSSEFFQREEYDQAVDDLNAIVFFCPKDSYQFTASGSILDAVRHSKPVIAFGNAYFRWIQRLVSGGSIALVDDLDQAEQVLRGWMTKGLQIRPAQDYQKLREVHSAEAAEKDFVKQLERQLGLTLAALQEHV